MAYHAGVLRALEEVGGVDPTTAGLIVGTSAGSMIGAHLRSGYSTQDLWELATDPEPPEGVFGRAWSTPVDLARRTLGSAFVLSRSAVRLPIPAVPAALRRVFPAGFYQIGLDDPRLGELLPEAWPDDPLWLCAVDIGSGRRVVLGRHGAPEATLHQGVLASCAIPGYYQPVRLGNRTLVDGGVHSSTNLDLAARHGCRLIVGIVPMAYDPRDAPLPIRRLSRQPATTSLAREVAFARGRDADVLLFRPTAYELRIHGTNAMRLSGNQAVTRAAYDAAARVLDTDRARRLLDDAAA
jgi:NTE family protein